MSRVKILGLFFFSVQNLTFFKMRFLDLFFVFFPSASLSSRRCEEQSERCSQGDSAAELRVGGGIVSLQWPSRWPLSYFSRNSICFLSKPMTAIRKKISIHLAGGKKKRNTHKCGQNCNSIFTAHCVSVSPSVIPQH